MPTSRTEAAVAVSASVAVTVGGCVRHEKQIKLTEAATRECQKCLTKDTLWHTHTHRHPLPRCPLCQPPLVSSAAAQKQQQLEWQTTTGNDQRAVAAPQRHQNHCHGLRRNCRANLTLTLKRSRSSRDWGRGRGRGRVGLLSVLWNNFFALLWLGLGYAGRTWQDSKTSCIYRQRRRRRRVQRIRNRKRKK